MNKVLPQLSRCPSSSNRTRASFAPMGSRRTRIVARICTKFVKNAELLQVDSQGSPVLLSNSQLKLTTLPILAVNCKQPSTSSKVLRFRRSRSSNRLSCVGYRSSDAVRVIPCTPPPAAATSFQTKATRETRNSENHRCAIWTRHSEKARVWTTAR